MITLVAYAAASGQPPGMHTCPPGMCCAAKCDALLRPPEAGQPPDAASALYGEGWPAAGRKVSKVPGDRVVAGRVLWRLPVGMKAAFSCSACLQAWSIPRSSVRYGVGAYGKSVAMTSCLISACSISGTPFPCSRAFLHCRNSVYCMSCLVLSLQGRPQLFLHTLGNRLHISLLQRI